MEQLVFLINTPNDLNQIFLKWKIKTPVKLDNFIP